MFAGKALKGPADRVMAALGLSPGTAGVLQAYAGLVSALIIDESDSEDETLSTEETRVLSTDTRMETAEEGRRFGRWLLDTMTT